MTKTTNLSKIKKNFKDNTLTYIGIVLAIAWPVFIGVVNLQVSLPCVVSPNNCTDGMSLAQAILYTPIIVGGIAFSAGVFSKVKINQELKSILILVSVIAMFIISFLLLIFATVAVHGFGG
jgi:hypothetical protein